MSIWKSYTRTVVQKIKCVSQDSFSAKVTSTTAMIVLASFVPVSALSNVTPFPPLLRVPGGLVKNDKNDCTERGKA